ncbi:glycosyltransferase [Arenimonas sp.]|uniref:glycosyltransferase n=1 Tax=Arenimonas sp. TaxID=1872635 RepID=UPI002E330740|nr:glycosyltransferase [Arenimonas sp.]HEX4854376.1 glycosyltransferase [Arenimonas sp.]
MKILFNYYAGGGGGLANIRRLLRAYALAFPADQLIVASKNPAQFSDLDGLPNVDLYEIALPIGGEVGRLWYGFFGLRKLASSLGVDVVWSMNLGSYIRGRTPQVTSINNAYQVYPLSVMRMHPAGWLRAAVMRFFSTLTMFASDSIVVQTRIMRDQAIRLAGRGKRVHVVAKAVEVSDFCGGVDAMQGEDDSPPAGFVFGYVATYFPHKNHERLIEALELLSRRRDFGPVVKLLATIDLADLPPRLRGVAARLIDSGLLSLVGWQSVSQLGEFYRRLDAVVIPSLLESLSSAHIEAMAFGKPILASDLPYARELCGDAALYVDPTNPNQLSEGMLAIASDALRRRSLVHAGSERMKMFPSDWRSIAGEVRSVLSDSIDGRPRAM